MFKIGDFSRLVRVSPRMLRHYEKCGLLYPAEIDKFTGYRQYSAGQIPLLAKIVTLRDLGFSIDEIGGILPRFDDTAYMGRILRAKAASVKATIEAEQEKYDKLMELSGAMGKEHKIMVHEVELKTLPAVKVVSLKGVIPHYSREGMLWERLAVFVRKNQVPCHRYGYSVYLDEEHKEENPEVEVAIPVDKLGASQGEFVYQEYREIPLAATVRFSGAFDGGYEAASEKLARWMEENGYAFAGPLRGHVLEMPDGEGKGLTELQTPVVKKEN